MYFIKFTYKDGQRSYFGPANRKTVLGKGSQQISLSPLSQATCFETKELAERVISNISKWEGLKDLIERSGAVASVECHPNVKPFRLYKDPNVGFFKRIFKKL